MAVTEHAKPAGSSWSALRYPDFRWMATAQFISYMGSWMQLAAVNWHVYALTKDPAALGLVGLVRVVPIIVLSLFGGVLADAVDRRRLMTVTSAAMAIVAFALGLITLSGGVTLGLLYAATALMAGLSAFDKPAWGALLPNLVPSTEVGNAVRLNVVIIQITAVAGPAFAGLLLALINPGGAYLFNALSFVPVIVALTVIHVQPLRVSERVAFSTDALLEGLRFVKRTPLLWSTMVLDFFATFFASATALLPVYASDILKVGEVGYGLLYAAPAVGATVGALAMAQIGARLKRQGIVLLGSVAVFGASTVIFGLSTAFVLSMLALAVMGLADAISMVIRNALRQLLTPDSMRGRMVSFNQIFFMGGPQLGELEAGLVARAFGAPFSVISGGIGAMLVVAVMWARVPVLRNYRELPQPVERTDEAGAASAEPLPAGAPAAGD